MRNLTNSTPKESSNNNHTFIIKTNNNNVSDLMNEIRVNNYNNTPNIISKSNDIFFSPKKIKEFTLLSYNLKNNKTNF